jgi:hypothetical protein
MYHYYPHYWFLMVSPKIRSPQHPKAPRPHGLEVVPPRRGQQAFTRAQAARQRSLQSVAHLVALQMQVVQDLALRQGREFSGMIPVITSKSPMYPLVN